MFWGKRYFRERCIAEICSLARDRGINISRCSLRSESTRYAHDKALNVVVDELESLKRQRKSYRVCFFVAAGNEPVPDEYVRAISEPPYDNRGVIGVTPNPLYQQANAQYRKEVSRISSEIEKELTPEWERKYQAALAEWREAITRWESTTSCPTCYGEGTHGTGQSGIGDVICEQCGGSGWVSTGQLDSAEPPVEPVWAQFRAVPQDELEKRLKNRGLDKLRDVPETFTVYARFEVD